MVYYRFGRGHIPTHPAETLRKRTHEDVDVGRVDAAVLAAALSRVPESADGVGLVQIPAWTSTGVRRVDGVKDAATYKYALYFFATFEMFFRSQISPSML